MTGLVPDELMLDVVKAELDRLRGKVRLYLAWIRSGSRLMSVELDHRWVPADIASRRATG